MTKKLIEVALPLSEINDASAYDKMPGIGPHPKGIHHWWARLPLPTARAVLFASVVDDPSSQPARFPTEEMQNAERERLFDILHRLMQKKMHEHPEVYAEAKAEMLKHCDGKLPPVLDPFAGGGSIPLEAARLGFEAHAADLNPVAVLLNKCNLELIPRWADQPPVNPEDRSQETGGRRLTAAACRGASGLAADVRYYGRVIRERAIAKIGHLYPKVRIVQEKDGSWRHATEQNVRSGKHNIREANVIAWLWARTVASPNPAAKGAHVPLMSTFWLSSKKGSEAWLEPVVDKAKGSWRFKVRMGVPTNCTAIGRGTKNSRGANFDCLLTGATLTDDYVHGEFKAKRQRCALVAIVADGGRGRVYLGADSEHSSVADIKTATGAPDAEMDVNNPSTVSGRGYGIKEWKELFTPRQLTAMVTLSDLVKAVRADVVRDASDAGLTKREAEAYAATVVTFLALALDRCADFNNSLCRWTAGNQKVMSLYSRQAIPMVWDFAEANMLGDSVGAWSTCSDYVAECIEVAGTSAGRNSHARQIDAASSWDELKGVLVSTDPPYYDNIGYAALSDFFYVWLRRTIGDLYPDLFKTILVPKEPELVAAPERFGGDKEKAKEHFETGFRKAFAALREKMDPRFPLTVYYAFKQEDEEAGQEEEERSQNAEGRSRNGVDRTTGWETLLNALLESGFQITATWPVRASQKWRMVAMGTNALASYIVLACRPRPADAPQCSRREFIAALKRELPQALKHLQQGNIAPVDLAQASIGPGMAVFSRYARVMEGSGNPMTVRTALALINQTLDEVLAEQEAEFDADTRWALAWFEQHGTGEGPFGDAETLSKAKNTAVNGLVEAGIISARGGKVRLVRREELPADWDPAKDKRLTVWEATQHLIRTLEQGGEVAAAELLRRLGSATGEVARELSYRLYKICERKGWSKEAVSYNGLVVAWPEIVRLAQAPRADAGQRELFRSE
jgi:putative DNA methylase